MSTTIRVVFQATPNQLTALAAAFGVIIRTQLLLTI